MCIRDRVDTPQQVNAYCVGSKSFKDIFMTIRASFKGSLGRDSEVKTVGDNNKVTKFSVASSSGYGDKKKTTWVNCEAWGDSYEKLSQYLLKGKEVLVYGKIDVNVYQAKDGTHKAEMKCRVSDIEFCGKKSDGEGEGNGHTNNSPSYDHQSPNPPAGKGGVDMDDDIPFSRFNENFQH